MILFADKRFEISNYDLMRDIDNIIRPGKILSSMF